MRRLGVFSVGVVLALSACVSPGPMTSGTPVSGLGRPAPENVAALAAPYQDLSDVRLNPEDRCYVYRYRGPVETTYLPLRTREGRPICAQPLTS